MGFSRAGGGSVLPEVVSDATKVLSLGYLLSLLLVEEVAFAEGIRVGIPGLSTEFAPVWAARDKGLLKKYQPGY